ncbi:liphatic nitrilase [Diaporthe amygdali]|uniref:liphatic nitrilase n=1 Tax=Phomopsis amygdali TaxID=1214568 RepID=UPI0022FE07B6|nr:liphatic nitrilase [Diaporthe amygdali]KAJ0122638.1 liphatic nitrilase [Diaporthe amygdali]
MSSSKVHVAVTQAEPVWLDLQGAVAKTCMLIKEAAGNKAQLIAFPECFIPGYPAWIWNRPVDFDINVKYIKNSLRVASPEMDTIKACARENGIAVSLGFSENDDDSLYISQALIGADGEVKVHRRKMKPTHMERTIFGDASGGDGTCLASVAQLPFARVGQLSCWEHIQPLLKFNTISQREQIHVAAWPSLTPHSGNGPDLWSMSAEARTYAIEATAFVLHSTAVLTEKAVEANGTAGSPLMGAPGGGTSAVFGPDGRRLTESLGDKEEGIIYADLDLDEITRIKIVDSNAKSLVRGAEVLAIRDETVPVEKQD